MDSQAAFNRPPPSNGAKSTQKRYNKRKQLQHSADIVYTKGSSIQTTMSLSKLLKGVTECIVGLQYVWEYRSPSKSVPPHYQCKLCAVSRLQHDMIAHVKGWKHSFRYLKTVHPDKVACEEEEAVKDPAVRKTIKEAAAEVERAEGRGILKVILKEPCEVPAFKGLRSAAPKFVPPLALGRGPKGPPPFGPMFSDQRFPPQGGLLPNYPGGDFREPDFGGFSTGKDYLHSSMDQRPFPDSSLHPDENSYGPGGRRDSFGRSGLLGSPGRPYTDEFRGGLLDRPVDKPLERPGLMGAAPESSNLPTTLLKYLDTFRIENENDAQLVLKVTQKLTDVLMEYRLRSVSTGSSMSSFSMGSSSSFSSTPSRMLNNDRFSSSLSGPSRFSDGPSRFYK